VTAPRSRWVLGEEAVFLKKKPIRFLSLDVSRSVVTSWGGGKKKFIETISGQGEESAPRHVTRGEKRLASPRQTSLKYALKEKNQNARTFQN